MNPPNQARFYGVDKNGWTICSAKKLSPKLYLKLYLECFCKFLELYSKEEFQIYRSSRVFFIINSRDARQTRLHSHSQSSKYCLRVIVKIKDTISLTRIHSILLPLGTQKHGQTPFWKVSPELFYANDCNALYSKDGLGTWEGEEGTTMQQGWKRGVSMKQRSTATMVELESICMWIDNHEITVIDNGDIRSGMTSKKARHGWRNHAVTVVRTGDREGHSQHPIPTPWKGRY